MCCWSWGSLYSLRNAAVSRIISLLCQCLLLVGDKKVPSADTRLHPKLGVFSVHAVSPQAQFLNLLLCRCFQLSYLEKHPEEAQEDSAGSAPRRNPSLLNHGFPLSVSALVSFRRAPFRGLLPGLKVWTLTSRIHLCDGWFALARTRFCANNGCCNQSYWWTTKCNRVSGLVVHNALKSKALVKETTAKMSL